MSPLEIGFGVMMFLCVPAPMIATLVYEIIRIRAERRAKRRAALYATLGQWPGIDDVVRRLEALR